MRPAASALDVVASNRRYRHRGWVASSFRAGWALGTTISQNCCAGMRRWALLLGLLIAKSLMWAFSLSSGTSGGVLAPLLMIGAAIGETAGTAGAHAGETQALWALMGMGAMLSGALGVPLTAILFSLELTHALPALLPLALACMASYLVTSLVMPRSILTEKLSRRGYHLSREYGVDPLETVSVAEVMTELPVSIEAVATSAGLVGLPEVYAYADETCRAVAEEMATTRVTSMPVIDRETGRILRKHQCAGIAGWPEAGGCAGV